MKSKVFVNGNMIHVPFLGGGHAIVSFGKKNVTIEYFDKSLEPDENLVEDFIDQYFYQAVRGFRDVLEERKSEVRRRIFDKGIILIEKYNPSQAA